MERLSWEAKTYTGSENKLNYTFPDNCQILGLNELYLKYFGYKKDGIFWEVGAYDGYNFSNTWGLAVAGWTGVYVEPVTKFAQLCANNHSNHPNINVLNLCAGDQDCIVNFYECGTLSTYSIEHKNSEYWKADYAHSTPMTARMMTLDKLFENLGCVKPGFELLVVDTEGSEIEVLKGFNVNKWLPKMAIVEVHEHHEAAELGRQAPWVNNYFADAGYEKIYSDSINNIYWRD
jgi:FkbM family methyltransferase